MNNPETTAVVLKPNTTAALQELVANVFLNSGDPVIEHVMSKSRPAAAYSKLDQVK